MKYMILGLGLLLSMVSSSFAQDNQEEEVLNRMGKDVETAANCEAVLLNRNMFMNATAILLFNYAEEHKDKKLKEAADNFIKRSISTKRNFAIIEDIFQKVVLSEAKDLKLNTDKINDVKISQIAKHEKTLIAMEIGLVDPNKLIDFFNGLDGVNTECSKWATETAKRLNQHVKSGTPT